MYFIFQTGLQSPFNPKSFLVTFVYSVHKKYKALVSFIAVIKHYKQGNFERKYLVGLIVKI